MDPGKDRSTAGTDSEQGCSRGDRIGRLLLAWSRLVKLQGFIRRDLSQRLAIALQPPCADLLRPASHFSVEAGSERIVFRD